MKKNKIDLTNAKDIFEQYANSLKNNPKDLKAFESAVNEAYNITGDIEIFLTALKIIALLRGSNITELAKKSNIERKSVYNAFKKGANPTFQNVNAVANNLGVQIRLSFEQISI